MKKHNVRPENPYPDDVIEELCNVCKHDFFEEGVDATIAGLPSTDRLQKCIRSSRDAWKRNPFRKAQLGHDLQTYQARLVYELITGEKTPGFPDPQTFYTKTGSSRLDRTPIVYVRVPSVDSILDYWVDHFGEDDISVLHGISDLALHNLAQAAHDMLTSKRADAPDSQPPGSVPLIIEKQEVLELVTSAQRLLNLFDPERQSKGVLDGILSNALKEANKAHCTMQEIKAAREAAAT